VATLDLFFSTNLDEPNQGFRHLTVVWLFLLAFYMHLLQKISVGSILRFSRFGAIFRSFAVVEISFDQSFVNVDEVRVRFFVFHSSIPHMAL
jgi:hypothetical protein